MSTSEVRPEPPHRIATKRGRPDNSASASPAREISAVPAVITQDDVPVPPFLRQSRAGACKRVERLLGAEISAKFEQLNAHQLQRLESARAGADQESSWAVDNSPQNKLRNRYLDIRPWEKQRIRLKVPEGVSDYINASPIKLPSSGDGDGEERKYIATQGPKQASVDHFWQMVWHEAESPVVIVMLTQLSEGFREKCYQYYPENSDGEGMSLSFTDAEGNEHSGILRVNKSSYDEESKTSVRTMQLNFDASSKLVYHLSFLGWPDFGVPENADRAALLALIKLSRQRNEGWKNPRFIHCSAGVGRSGTFIALENLLDEVERGLLDDIEGDEDPIFEAVDHLREQRMSMVQSEIQFAFIYEITAEAYRERRRNMSPIDDHAQSVDKVTSATAKLLASGEPSPKAIRLSRGLRRIYHDIRSRSLSRKASDDAERHKGRPGSEPPNGREGAKNGDKPGTPLSEVHNPLNHPEETAAEQ